MDLNEVKTWMEENAQNEDVQSYIGGFVTVDRVNKFLDETEEGKKIIQPKIDSHFTKGLETWKNNNLEKLINEEVVKRNSKKDSKDIELEEIKTELAKMKSEKAREALTNKAIKLMNGKKMPLDLVDFIVSADNDEDTTTANLTKLEEIFNKHITDAVEERLKNGYKPPGGGKTDETELLREQIRKSLNGGF